MPVWVTAGDRLGRIWRHRAVPPRGEFVAQTEEWPTPFYRGRLLQECVIGGPGAAKSTPGASPLHGTASPQPLQPED